MITRKHSSSLRVLHAQIWHLLPQNIKSSDSIFKLEDLEKGCYGYNCFFGQINPFMHIVEKRPNIF